MKNPLVDALRLANSSFSDLAIERAEAPAPAAVPKDPDDSRELALLDTLVTDDLDADFYATSSFEVANDDDDMQIVANGPADVLPRQAPPINSGKSGMPKLGRYSPLLCLVLLAVTAGVYFGFQNMAGRYQNVDLQVLSAQVDTTHRTGDPAVPDSQLYTNPFQLIVGPQKGATELSR